MKLFIWLMVALSWLAGVVWQTGAGALSPIWLDALTLGLVGGMLCWTWLWQRMGMPRRARPWRWLLLSMACVLLAWASTGWRASLRMQEALPDHLAEQDLPVIVQVEGLPQATAGAALFDARVLQWPGLPDAADPGRLARLPRLISLSMPLRDGDLPRAGQRWQLVVRLHAPDGLSNPTGFDPTLAYFERGVRAVGRVRDKPAPPIKLSDRAERPWQGTIDRLRHDVRDRIQAHVSDKQAAGILAGLSVGDQSAIGRDDWTLFRHTGVAHLVSISGAHIAMFGWMAAALVRRVWSRWPRGVHACPAPDVAMWAAVLASAAYAVLAGWGIPAQRTVWMMALAAVLRTGGRRWPWPLVWLASAVLVTALDPWAIRQVGFWLSYVAVGVLLSSWRPAEPDAAEPGSASTAAPMARSMASGARWLWQASGELVRIQNLITLSLLPLGLVAFQQSSISSLVANLVAIPVFTVGITPLTMLGVVWGGGWDGAVWLVQWVMHFLAMLDDGWLQMAEAPVVPPWAAWCAVLAGFALALPMQWRWRMGLLPFVMCLLYLPQGWHIWPAPRAGQFAVMAVDVGQGTAVLVRTAHHTLLFDAGPKVGAALDAGERTLLLLLRALGIGSLDVLMISHEDADHTGGAASLLRQMPVARLLSSLGARHALRAQVDREGTLPRHEPCLAGLSWHWDGVQFDVLHPEAGELAQAEAARASNEVSCVLKVSAAGHAPVSMLLTGDIEAEQEAKLVARAGQALRSTVLVAPHHGSQTSSTTAFLQAVQPRQIVVQAGRRNRYGHPSPAVLARYEAMGLAWVASPACGAYLWRSDESVSGGQASAASPLVGACWRPAHQRYWDRPSPS